MPCPFALHLWIPTEFSLVDYGRMLSEAASNDTAELRFVWAKRGSTAMTTTGGVVLNPTFPYEFDAHPPPLSETGPPRPVLTARGAQRAMAPILSGARRVAHPG